MPSHTVRSNQTGVQLVQRIFFLAVFWHINCLIRFTAPIADAIFFDISVICFFQDRFLSIKTPKYFV